MKKVVPLHYIKQAMINFKISMIITIIAEIIVLVSNAKSGKIFSPVPLSHTLRRFPS